MMEAATGNQEQVWLVFDKQRPKLLPNTQRHVGPSDPNALMVTSSDGITTPVNGKWFEKRSTAAKDLSQFEFTEIQQLLDLLQGFWPIALEASEMKRVSQCAAAVGKQRLSEVLTFSLLASDYLTDRSTLAGFSEAMGKLNIAKESPWDDFLWSLCRVSTAKNGKEFAGGLFIAAAGPVLSTVAAKVLSQMPDDLSLWTRKKLLFDPLEKNYPQAQRLLEQLGLTRDDILSPIDRLKDQAEGGDVEAQFELATHFRHNGSTLSDLCDTTIWAIKAAKQNHPLALEQLGHDFLHGGTILPKNPSLGNRYLEKAASLKRNRSESNLEESFEL
jgi:hypothetical protein